MIENRPLRFCMITTFYPPYNFGGDGIFVQRLAHELAQRGHHVTVVHSVDAHRLRGKPPSAEPIAEHPNIAVHRLASRAPLASMLLTQQTGTPGIFSSEMRRLLQKKFDVIHYHNVSLMGAPQVLGWGNAIKFYSVHEYWLVCPTHVLFQNKRAVCETPHCLMCQLIYKRPPQVWRHTRALQNAGRHVDAFIAPSRFSADIHQRFGFQFPFQRLPYFVPEMDLSHRVEPTSPYFLYVGRLEKLKGVHTLIPLFRDFTAARLWIAGAGDLESELYRATAGCENIQFLGRLRETELQPLYRNATAVIIPSLAYEGFPLVALEAFRQQTPIIARNLGALPEIVEASGGGLLYNSDAELIAALKRLLANPGEARELGLRGYQSFQKKWTVGAFMDAYFNLIHEQQEHQFPKGKSL